jgi:hypothetical protein
VRLARGGSRLCRRSRQSRQTHDCRNDHAHFGVLPP